MCIRIDLISAVITVTRFFDRRYELINNGDLPTMRSHYGLVRMNKNKGI